MTETTEDDVLLGRLNHLVARSRTIRSHDRRLVLSLESDLRALRAALHARSDALAQKMSMAGARSQAVSAYSRIAFLGRSIASAPTTK
jgi:hypothetical protein